MPGDSWRSTVPQSSNGNAHGGGAKGGSSMFVPDAQAVPVKLKGFTKVDAQTSGKKKQSKKEKKLAAFNEQNGLALPHVGKKRLKQQSCLALLDPVEPPSKKIKDGGGGSPSWWGMS